jgi:hypothetical protein
LNNLSFQIFSFIALIFSLWGNWLINKQNKQGYTIWIISNVVWIVVDVYLHNWFQLIMYLFYIVLNIQGYILWSKKK